MSNVQNATGLERRQHERASVLLRVESRDATRFDADYVTDIGEGGLFLHTATPLAIGTTVKLWLSFPGLLEPMPVTCVVRWISQALRDDGEREQTGLGMSFAASSPEEKARLAPLLRVLRRERQEILSRAKEPFRVLLVEDNRFVRELFKHAVSRFETTTQSGVVVSTAESALEALRLLRSSATPHLIVADHYMPGLSGSELVRRLRLEARFSRTPILMASVGGSDVKQEALEAGVTLFLDKPVLLAQLVDTMGALLAQAELAA